MAEPGRTPYAEWFSQSGFAPLNDHATVPLDYARRLVRYISDPSTVRVRVLERHGIAPPVERIRSLRQEWVEVIEHRAGHNYTYGMTDAERRAEERRSQPAPKPTPPPALKPPTLKLVEPEPQPAPEPEPQEPKQYVMITPADVIDAVADICDVSHGEIIGTLRDQEFVKPRNLVCALLRARGGSLTNIGKRIGGRDHSTVMNSLRKFFDRDLRFDTIRRGWMHLAPGWARNVTSPEELDAIAFSSPGVPRTKDEIAAYLQGDTDPASDEQAA
jgi:hypothetical protein